MKTPNISQWSPMLQILTLFGIIFVSLFMMMLLGNLIASWGYGINILDPDFAKDPSAEGVAPVQRWLMVLNQIGFFLIPALLFGQMAGNKQQGFFPIQGFHKTHLVIVLLLGFFLQAPINFMLELNQAIPVGDEMRAEIEALESSAEQVIFALLGKGSGMDVFISLIILALIPALAEEFFFRGVIQKTFFRSFQNIHLAIWMTAIVFSFIHMQFLGFIPRVVLGALLGYVMVWTGSIWASVLLHFINNAISVMLMQMVVTGKIEESAQHIGAESSEWIFVLFGFLASGFLLFLMHKFRSPNIYNHAAE